MVNDVRKRCRLFMIKLCEEIKKRFDLDDDIWKMTPYFNPKQFLDHTTRDVMPSLSPLLAKVPILYNVDVQVLDNEWRNLDSIPVPPDINHENCNPIDFYLKLGTAKLEI